MRAEHKCSDECGHVRPRRILVGGVNILVGQNGNGKLGIRRKKLETWEAWPENKERFWTSERPWAPWNYEKACSTREAHTEDKEASSSSERQRMPNEENNIVLTKF